MHCKLADNRRISEVFREVTILSMLSGAEGTSALDHGESIAALADADGTLPFARMEGLAVAGVERTRVGGAVTTAHLRDAITSGGTLLISCHGSFVADNPWVSSINTADGELALHEVLTGHHQRPGGVVVLGVCEAGRSRRTASDEPLGFPGLLILSGVSVVVAPLWPVDDLAALLFVTRLFGSRRQLPIAEAVARTADWLRTLTVAETQRELDALVTRLEATPEGVAVIQHARPRLDESRAWLGDRPSTDTPFSSPVDWAAFQVTRASM
jgi:CHAT domain-containing protein